jgi:hypothetical protein
MAKFVSKMSTWVTWTNTASLEKYLFHIDSTKRRTRRKMMLTKMA